MIILILVGCVSVHEGNEDAKSFIMTFYPEAKSIMARCQTYDTDHNGYVSCTGKVDDKLIAMECPVKPIDGCVRNTECRLAKGVATQSVE